MTTISRRDLFKFGGVAAAGVAGASMLGACSPQQPTAATGAGSEGVTAADGTPAFFVKPEPITDIAETKDYDVVVIGAGAAGVPAAISAFEVGAKVALLQKEATAVSQGNTCDSIIVEETAPAAWRPWSRSSTPTAATCPIASRCACGPTTPARP